MRANVEQGEGRAERGGRAVVIRTRTRWSGGGPITLALETSGRTVLACQPAGCASSEGAPSAMVLEMSAEVVLACMPACCACLKAAGSRAAPPAEPGCTGAAKGLAGPAVQVLAGADEGSMAADSALVPRRSFEAARASAAMSKAFPTAPAAWRSPKMLAMLRGLLDEGSMAADAAVVPRQSFEAAEASAAFSMASPTPLAV